MFLILTYFIIQLIFKLYSLNYIIPEIALSYLSNRMSKFIITLCSLILTYISPISRLIIPSLYSTGSPEIVTSK